MEMERLEFTIEDILAIHQGWITKLYVQDRRTEAEIVELLSQQKLIVTQSQVEKCIREWNLQPPPTFPFIPELEGLISAALYTISREQSLQNYQSHGNMNSHFTFTNLESDDSILRVKNNEQPGTAASLNQSVLPPSLPRLTTNNPSHSELYSTRPLPPLPSDHVVDHAPSRNYHHRHFPASPTSSSFITTRRCRHGRDPRDCSEVRYCLQSLPGGPSSLQVYTGTEQFHEKVAVGLFEKSDGLEGLLGQRRKPQEEEGEDEVDGEEEGPEQDGRSDEGFDEDDLDDTLSLPQLQEQPNTTSPPPLDDQPPPIPTTTSTTPRPSDQKTPQLPMPPPSNNNSSPSERKKAEEGAVTPTEASTESSAEIIELKYVRAWDKTGDGKSRNDREQVVRLRYGKIKEEIQREKAKLPRMQKGVQQKRKRKRGENGDSSVGSGEGKGKGKEKEERKEKEKEG